MRRGNLCQEQYPGSLDPICFQNRIQSLQLAGHSAMVDHVLTMRQANLSSMCFSQLVSGNVLMIMCKSAVQTGTSSGSVHHVPQGFQGRCSQGAVDRQLCRQGEMGTSHKQRHASVNVVLCSQVTASQQPKPGHRRFKQACADAGTHSAHSRFWSQITPTHPVQPSLNLSCLSRMHAVCLD